MSKKTRLMVGVIISLAIIGIAQLALADVLSNWLFLPLAVSDGALTPTSTGTTTSTPTITPTPTSTPTSTPTATLLPSNSIQIYEVYNPLPKNFMDEYIVLYNASSSSVDLTGWYVRDDGVHRYDFPNQFVMKGKQKVWLWTKSGTNSTYELFWGSDEEIWNDFYDCVYLRDYADGDKILKDLYCYGDESTLYLQTTPVP